LIVLVQVKEELKFADLEHGKEFATIIGLITILMQFVDFWDIKAE